MEDDDLNPLDGSGSMRDNKADKKRSPNKLTEAKTGYSPQKKKIKGEVLLPETSEEELSCGAPSMDEELEEEADEGLQKLGLDPLQALEVLLLNSVLHIEMREDPSLNPYNPLMVHEKRALELDYTKIPSGIISEFERLGGNRGELEKKIHLLKMKVTSPIRNPNYPVGVVYTPAARSAELSRHLIQQGREEGIFRHLFVDFNIAPFIPETPEEREERKKQQLIDFLSVEKRRGKISKEEIAAILDKSGGEKSKEAIAEIKREIEIWQDHLAYIEMRKNQLTGGKVEVLDEDEFEDDS